MLTNQTNYILVSLRHVCKWHFCLVFRMHVPISTVDMLAIHMRRWRTIAIASIPILVGTTIGLHSIWNARSLTRWRSLSTVFTVRRRGQTDSTFTVACTSLDNKATHIYNNGIIEEFLRADKPKFCSLFCLWHHCIQNEARGKSIWCT